jgi:hypothetical protein
LLHAVIFNYFCKSVYWHRYGWFYRVGILKRNVKFQDSGIPEFEVSENPKVFIFILTQHSKSIGSEQFRVLFKGTVPPISSGGGGVWSNMPDFGEATMAVLNLFMASRFFIWLKALRRR